MTLEDEGYATKQAAGAAEARNLLLSEPPKLAILDIWMRDSDMDGLELLEWSKSIYPDLPILMISGHGTIETAVQAIRNGAYDFIEKPLSTPKLLISIKRALESERLIYENKRLKEMQLIEAKGINEGILQKSQTVDYEKLAMVNSHILIIGEGGTGKETLARYIHLSLIHI